MGTKNKFTPGPWKVEPNPFEAAPTVAAKYRTIAKVLYWEGSEDHHVNANARLIAAAPTMYEYIQKRADIGDTEAIEILESINAKAKGEK